MLHRVTNTRRVWQNVFSVVKNSKFATEVDKTVQQDSSHGLFYIKLNGERATLEYKWLDSKTLEVLHTDVPTAFQGQGLAQVLAKHVFEYVIQKDLKMKLSCSSAINYLEKNPLPKYKERVAEKELVTSSCLNMDNYEVHHDISSKTFYIDLGKGERAVLEYEYLDKQTLDMYHTGVPHAYRGKGIAKILAKAAFDYVVKNDLKMKLSCSYLDKFSKENDDAYYKEIIV